jgi:ATP-binding cassette subfamily F protein 3
LSFFPPFIPGKPIEEYRRLLGSFGVSGDLALQNIASLSGGQKSRVAFAVLGTARPNFLILDEPTNHLDIETIEALGKALGKYQVSATCALDEIGKVAFYDDWAIYF